MLGLSIGQQRQAANGIAATLCNFLQGFLNGGRNLGTARIADPANGLLKLAAILDGAVEISTWVR